MRRVSFTGNFGIKRKEGSGNGSFLSTRDLLGEPGGGSLTWDPEGYVKNDLQTGISHFMLAPF